MARLESHRERWSHARWYVLALVVLLAGACTSRTPTAEARAKPAGGATSLPESSQPQQTASPAIPADPLPSWNAGAARDAIVAFVARVTRQDGPDFVPPSERIATFDNDGTLWCEQQMQVQFLFLVERMRRSTRRGTMASPSSA